jgi:Xaa-Pro aminopeptidase
LPASLSLWSWTPLPTAHLSSKKKNKPKKHKHKQIQKTHCACIRAGLTPAVPTPLNEFTAGAVLDDLRAELPDFVSLSFSNIVGSDANGAVIHYSATESGAAPITADSLVLVDSGGQFRDGTTDVTRTIATGPAHARHIECYTAVLRGHVGLAMQTFPTGTRGTSLDVLARAPLWEAGLDYRHGTGHGVGSFLNVHEGPHAITFRKVAHESPLEPGMLVTVEPGYYEDGAFGIRIENVMVVERATLKNDFGGVGWLRLRPITLVPLEPRLIDVAALSNAERKWINDYHVLVKRELTPLLKDHPRALAWVERCTKEI